MSPLLSCEEVKNMNGKKKTKNRSGEIIKRQAEEIESLKKQVSELKQKCKQKDELIASVEPMRNELKDIISNVRKKSEEYDKLISDVRTMRKVFDKEVFKGRWWIIKRLLK